MSRKRRVQEGEEDEDAADTGTVQGTTGNQRNQRKQHSEQRKKDHLRQYKCVEVNHNRGRYRRAEFSKYRPNRGRSRTQRAATMQANASKSRQGRGGLGDERTESREGLLNWEERPGKLGARKEPISNKKAGDGEDLSWTRKGGGRTVKD